jgi:HEAT repeat protein
VLVYLHVSGAGPLLSSGVWLITSERFNPRTAKKGFGRVAAAGTFGGLVGALLAERVAAVFGGPWMLLVLAALQFLSAWLVRVLAASGEPIADAGSALPEGASLPQVRSGLRVIAEAPYLRNVVVLVVLGTTSATLLDYLFKGRAVETFGTGDGLLRFFALYYAGSSLIAFVLQTLTSRAVLERFGLTLTTSAPSIALLAGSIGGLVAPGFGSLVVARGGESIFRGSWFRAGYELFYTPIPAAEKRAAKSIIDVGFDRLGDAVGAAFVRLVILIAPAAQSPAILLIAMACSVGAIAASSRLNRWYLRTLESSLVNRGGGINLLDSVDESTAEVLLSMRKRHATRYGDQLDQVAWSAATTHEVMRDIVSVRSSDRDAAIQVLSRPVGLKPEVVPHVIPLLAPGPLADYALFALRKVVEEHVGQLTDALLDPNRDWAVRQRLARVFSVGVSQRAADALMQALDDTRFDVRFQVARSLAAILDRNTRVQIDRERIYATVLREVAVSRPVWESQRMLDVVVSESALDGFVRDRAGQSLAHVFTLLSLVLPREPLQIAFRSLHSGDAYLRGTALEYLEGVLPQAVRQRLWPFLVRPRGPRATPDRDAIIAGLLRSNASVTLKGMVREAQADRMAASAPSAPRHATY